VVRIVTVKSLNTLPTIAGLGLSPAARLVSTTDQTGDYGATYTQVFADGQGWLSTSESFPYPDNPDIIVYTVRHANEEPVPPAGVSNARVRGVSISESSEVTIYTATYVTGSGLIGSSSSTRLNNTLETYSYRFLQEVDPNLVVGEIVSESVSSGQYGDVISVRSVDLAAPYIISENTVEMMPGVYRHEVTTLVEPPQDYAGSFGGTVTRTAVRTSETDLGTQYNLTYIEAVDGTEISTATGNQPSGAATTTKTIVGTEPNPLLPSGSYLTDLTITQSTGYATTRFQYYQPPPNYTLSAESTIQIPGALQVDTSTIAGYLVTRAPTVRTITSTLSVEFTDRPPNSEDNRALLNPTAYVSVDVVGATPYDPTRQQTEAISNHWATPATGFYRTSSPTDEGFKVRGNAKVSGVSSALGQTIVLLRVVEPFFFSGGAQVYKVTTQTVSL